VPRAAHAPGLRCVPSDTRAPRPTGAAACLFSACLVLLGATSAVAQVPDPDPERFAEEIAAFARWDAKNAVPRDAVLFVGSSSIRMWNTAERFQDLPVVNRGFGGAHISDVNHFLHETVLRYVPSVIVFYAGDNDVEAGKSADQVLADYEAFVRRVSDANPSTQIVFVAIKPSLARWTRWPEMRTANDRVRSYSETRANLRYTDVATPMLEAGGEPRAELFVSDGLHLSEAGYDLWTTVVKQTLGGIQ
jgi:lysophospholipase L1-like esterase